ncbi:MAG: DUF3800 domain-containing protein [Candidatus Symbiobacter sp.]|nr:DUF3800 domain-containing protein [Candidatus Symbiobacter sp.]
MMGWFAGKLRIEQNENYCISDCVFVGSFSLVWIMVLQMNNNFGDWLIFADESGDHGFGGAQTEFPVLAITFMLIRKEDYAKILVPAVKLFKHKYWGHDCIILHEREIRHKEGAFSFLQNPDIHKCFMDDLNELISSLPIRFFTTVIHKNAPKNKDVPEWWTNPYHSSFGRCLILVNKYFKFEGTNRSLIPIIAEQRGKNEDKQLRSGFDDIASTPFVNFNQFSLIFCPKSANDEGLQIADLAVRPIAKWVQHPSVPNRAINILQTKMENIWYYSESGTKFPIFDRDNGTMRFL